MDSNQFIDLITAIRDEYDSKINKLHQEKNQTIASLENLFNMKEEIVRVSNSSTAHATTTGALRRRITIPSVPVRMKTALNKMQGEFERLSFFDIVNSDETGLKSPIGTLALAFSNLIKNGEIIEVQKPRGTKKGKYRRSNEGSVDNQSISTNEISLPL